MQQKQSEAQAREEFFNKMERRFADKILTVEMVCIEADRETFALLKLKPTQKHALLWGLLIIGEKDLIRTVLCSTRVWMTAEAFLFICTRTTRPTVFWKNAVPRFTAGAPRAFRQKRR